MSGDGRCEGAGMDPLRDETAGDALSLPSTEISDRATRAKSVAPGALALVKMLMTALTKRSESRIILLSGLRSAN